MNKILEGAKEALKVAKCDHDLIQQPEMTEKLVCYYCTKCQAKFWINRNGATGT